MGFAGGYTGKMLVVDLTNQTYHEEPTSEDMAGNFIGGAGINAALALKYLMPHDDPLSPTNYLIFGAGPMVGTMTPGSGKCNLTGRSVHTKFLGTTNQGYFGMLKFAGYDHLLITGRAETPVYLKIEDGTVTFCSAGHLWGKDLFEATDVIHDEAGKDFHVTCIGPAGENKVYDASIYTEKFSSMSRVGMGAVMGSKNLKALAILGTRSVGIADKKRYLQVFKTIYNGVRMHPNILHWRKYGTMISVETFAKMGVYAADNFQRAFDHKFFEMFSPDRFVAEIKEGDVACLACPIGCKHYLQIKEGQFAGTKLSVGCMNAVIQTFGGYCTAEGLEEVIKCAETAARMGIDWMTSSTLISLVMELYERGLLTKEQADGLEPKFGKGDVIRTLIRKIAYREGIGDVLADGFENAAARLGPEAGKYAMSVKGLGLVFDPRITLKSTEIFSLMTNVRGHGSNVSIAMVPRTPDQIRRYCVKLGLPDDAVERIVDDKGYNVARLTKWVEDLTSILNNLGICYFPLYQRLPTQTWADLYSAVTGIEVTIEDLIRMSENYWDVQKAYNLREGATIDDDTMPERFFTEEVSIADKQVAPPLDKKYVKQLLNDYYQERGWERETGIPPREKLDSLGISL
jgi:aldehyde:ferredoxin oxidoreductase